MPLPPTIFPAKRRVRRKRRAVSSPAPVAPLTLVSAVYTVGVSVTLTFDRAVVVEGSDPSQVVVDDGAETGQQWQGVDATLAGPAVVVVGLAEAGPTAAAATLLTATATTRFFAADDGATWAGVAELPLPFPAAPANAIVWVLPGAAAGTFVVHLTQPLVAYDDVEKMLGVSADGGETWSLPAAIDVSDPVAVVFTFDGDVGGATQWYVPGPSNWHFANGQPMAPPFSGAVG